MQTILIVLGCYLVASVVVTACFVIPAWRRNSRGTGVAS